MHVSCDMWRQERSPLLLLRAMASLLSLRLPHPCGVRASSSTATTLTSPSPAPQALEEAFGRKGIKFTESGGVPTVELSVRNGSSLHLRVNDALITSYKPKVYWKDDGCREVLHTVSAGDSQPAKGGIGLVLNEVSKSGVRASPLCASEWTVKDADSDSFDAVQVELGCTNSNGSLDISYVVSLYPVSVATAVIVKNNGLKPVELTSAILSHIKFDKRRGSAIEGLRGCSYCTHPPLPSSFSILSPAEAMEPDPPGWFSFLGSGDSEEPKKGSWVVENNLYTILRRKLSRVYTAPPAERTKRIYSTPPSKYTTIDQWSGLGFRVVRMGYDDIYLCSPGSLSEKFGKEYFVCTGPASMLVPVVLNPGEEWRAAQVIEHDNL